MNVNNNETQLERMKELIGIIKAADIAYYRDDNPSFLQNLSKQ